MNRVKAGCSLGFTYWRSAITEGIGIDRFSCQYCGSPHNLTFDHVVPRRLGGRTSWENVATACAPCNMKKGGRTPRQAHMPLLVEPIRPTSWHLQQHGRAFPPGYLHETWRDWLYWDVELES